MTPADVPVVPPLDVGGGLDDRFFDINQWADLINEGAFQNLTAQEWTDLFDWWGFLPEAAEVLHEIYEGLVGRGNAPRMSLAS